MRRRSVPRRLRGLTNIIGQADARRLHLRFDKVALELMDRVSAGIAGSVPAGHTVLFSITAPIWRAGKTAAAMVDAIIAYLGTARRSDLRRTFEGNQVRARLVKTGSKRSPKAMGFVHNPETDPNEIFAFALERIIDR